MASTLVTVHASTGAETRVRIRGVVALIGRYGKTPTVLCAAPPLRRLRSAVGSGLLAGTLGVGGFVPASVAFAAGPPRSIGEEISSAHEAGDFDRAIALLEEAFAANPRPEYLYSEGEIRIAAGDCAGAKQAFDRFLATQPPQQDSDWVRGRIRDCVPSDRGEGASAAGPQPSAPTGSGAAPAPGYEPTAPAPGDEPQADRAEVAAADHVRAGRTDRVALGLGIGGGVLAAVGAGLLVGARSASGRARSVDTEGAWEQQVRRTRALSTSGAVLLSVGGAAIVGAVVHALLVRRRGRSTAGGGRAAAGGGSGWIQTRADLTQRRLQVFVGAPAVLR